MKVYQFDPKGLNHVKVIPWRGTTGASGDYATLLNKPSINSVQLNGNKTTADLGLVTIRYQEIDCKIDSVTQYGRSKNFDVSGIQKLLSANFVYNNDLYYYIMDDGIVPVLSVRSTEKTITIFCTGGTSNTSRTLKVRLAYIPTDA